VKACTKCNKIKDLGSFHNCSSKADGKYTWCNECRSILCKNYYINNTESIREKTNTYYHSHKVERNLWEKNKLESDVLFKLRKRLRHRLRMALYRNQWGKSFSSIKDLGCSLEELKKHLESKFQSGMNWSNYGNGKDKWNIDHIIPLASVSSIEEIKDLCHYKNLQPLWFIDNIKKGDKIIMEKVVVQETFPGVN